MIFLFAVVAAVIISLIVYGISEREKRIQAESKLERLRFRTFRCGYCGGSTTVEEK